MTESTSGRSVSGRPKTDRAGRLRWLLDWIRCAATRRHGFRAILWPDLSWRPCWSRSGLPTRWRPACRASMASMQPSFRCSCTQCSGPAASWCWGRTSSRPRHPEHRPSVIRRGSPARGDVGRHAGSRFGDDMHPDGHRAPGFRDRAHLQADTLRLHERNCAHRIDQPAPALFGFSIEDAGPLRHGRSPARSCREK